MSKLSFAGHETFVCKQFWLKKGYDYLKQNRFFNDSDAIAELGVGKNMVSSIQYWLKAFGLLQEDNKTLSDLAHFIFDLECGKDPYIEDLGTLWLLHYQLIKSQRASLYNIIFNELRKERFDFNKDTISYFVNRKCQEAAQEVSPNTLQNDIMVFLRMYLKPDRATEKIDIEDTFTGLLLDLDLVKSYKKYNLDNKLVDWYRIASEERADLPFEIVLYAILDAMEDEGKTSITLKEMQQMTHSPLLTFAITLDGLFEKIQQMTDAYKGKIVYSEHAGVQVLQFKSTISKFEVLHAYYQ